mmetsp:Transcript_8514/g.19963  ORF Transcript_8514/g.19963 Transcript_8514/m.19963 type:complete len:219 (+) Transcript_8514:198-854(+)
MSSTLSCSLPRLCDLTMRLPSELKPGGSGRRGGRSTVINRSILATSLYPPPCSVHDTRLLPTNLARSSSLLSVLPIRPSLTSVLASRMSTTSPPSSTLLVILLVSTGVRVRPRKSVSDFCRHSSVVVVPSPPSDSSLLYVELSFVTPTRIGSAASDAKNRARDAPPGGISADISASPANRSVPNRPVSVSRGAAAAIVGDSAPGASIVLLPRVRLEVW